MPRMSDKKQLAAENPPHPAAIHSTPPSPHLAKHAGRSSPPHSALVEHAHQSSSSVPPQRSHDVRRSHNKASKARAFHRSRKRMSKSPAEDPHLTDLTSFPAVSDSESTSPEGFQGDSALNPSLSQALLSDGDRGRKAALVGLTAFQSEQGGRAALFDDSILIRDVPGSLHLANDNHIERMIEQNGAVKLIRQFARDLALRDAEISAMRNRADERERELKKMLRELNVTNHAIERRLYVMENNRHNVAEQSENTGVIGGFNSQMWASRSSSIDMMMDQAMTDDIGALESFDEHDLEEISEHVSESEVSETPRGRSDTASSRNRWLDFWSRKSSPSGESGNHGGNEYKKDARKTSPIRKSAFDEGFFHFPDGPLDFKEVANETKPSADDTSSTHSRTSSKALANWTARLFAGNSQLPRDKDGYGHISNSSEARSRAESNASSGSKDRKAPVSSSQPGPKPHSSSAPITPSGSTVATKRLSGHQSSAAKPSSIPTARASRPRQLPLSSRETAHAQPPRSLALESRSSTHNDDSAQSGPVELDAIIPSESCPPALTEWYQNTYNKSDNLLTDRFGFIYDRQPDMRQRQSVEPSARSAQSPARKRTSTGPVETLQNMRRLSVTDPTPSPANEAVRGPVVVSSEDLGDAANSTANSTHFWQDYLRIATKPTELLSHTPTGERMTPSPITIQPRPKSVTVDSNNRAIKITNTPTSISPSTSDAVANKAEFANPSSSSTMPPSGKTNHFDPSPPSSLSSSSATSATVTVTNSQPAKSESVKSLLDGLTHLHDTLQHERTVKWNEFLRKIRTERHRGDEAAAAASQTSSDRAALASAPTPTPEAAMADGEVIGIASLGNKGKVGRAKWMEFRRLVLGGIPVTLRAKIWSECSGASVLRVPGYYDGLVAMTNNDDDTNGHTYTSLEAISQIETDIHRTLTDNVFFRKGPGIAKLKEVLLAYARRNPQIGYCQGMNLIAGSLLLIMPTAEDTFWILTSIVENILPPQYYDSGFIASRADQIVLRQYVSEVLPKLSAHLDKLGIQLEALTFQWFLSLFTDCLSAEALYRVWDVVFCLNASSSAPAHTSPARTAFDLKETTNPCPDGNSAKSTTSTPSTKKPQSISATDCASARNLGGGSVFLFQVTLALLKLNEQQLLSACTTPSSVYTYISQEMTNHAISIDGLIQASEALRNVIKKEDVANRRAAATREVCAQVVGE